MNFKTKILLLAITPLVIATTCITALSVHQAKNLSNRTIDSFSKNIFDLRRTELKNYVELALSSVKSVYKDTDDINRRQEKAKVLLKNMRYGNDGYFFVSDYQGNIKLHPELPHLEGRSLWDIQDPNGIFLARSLIEQAQKPDGGYTEYVWDKPSLSRNVDKISFSNKLENWEWIIGTGLYVDDLEDAIKGIRIEVDSSINTTLQLLAGLGALLTVLVGFIGIHYTLSESRLANEKLKQLSRNVVQSQEEERSQIAKKLQQNISHQLNNTLLELQQIIHFRPNTNLKEDKPFLCTLLHLKNIIDDVQHLSGELVPTTLDKKGLFPAVKALVKKVKESHRINITLHVIQPSKTKLAYEVEISAYRIIQEALDNVIKHANANEVKIRLRQTTEWLSISIRDNGIGFSDEKGQNRTELTDIHIRIEALGGTLHVFPNKNGFTFIKAEIPLL